MNKVNRPGDFKKDIRNTAECAFQRSIILGKQSELNGVIVKWLDIELPVDVSGHARGRCIDLIGIDENGNYVLCELKFRKNYKDNGSPNEAAKQLRDYDMLIKSNYKLFNETYHHANAESIDWQQVASGNTRLVVAANKVYWESWLNPRRKVQSYDTKGIEYYSVNIEEDAFKRQKENRERYIPIMPNEGRVWYRVDI